MSFEHYQQSCLDKLTWATGQLNIEVESSQLVKIAELIVQTMTGHWRYFHTPEHIFMVGGSEDPIEILAALFHDVVYVQVDQSVNFNLSYYITPFIKQVREKLVVRESEELPYDFTFEMVTQIFGITPGQILSPFAGQNEFLSALVGAKVYQSFLPPWIIFQIVACIEATIPFRPKSTSGSTSSEQLYLRLQQTNTNFNLGLRDSEIVETVKKTVRLANRDVSSFAHPSAAHFLDNTWSLLPETNHHFDNPSAYTVYDYRIALQKMAGFLDFLKPEVVFQQFQEEPNDYTYQRLIKQAQNNLEIARLYLGTKLFTIAFLEALSLRIGKDIPLATMMGELPVGGLLANTLANFLPPIINAHKLQNDLEREVFTLLEVGRSKSSAYDLKNSPLATFMVKFLGFEEIKHLRNLAEEFFQGHLCSEEFLGKCNYELIEIVTEKILELFDSRKTALTQSNRIDNNSNSAPMLTIGDCQN